MGRGEPKLDLFGRITRLMERPEQMRPGRLAMAEDAVSSEPFSFNFSPAPRENTGKFLEFRICLWIHAGDRVDFLIS